jgi:hypothetical protein
VGDNVPVDGETLLVTDFVNNLKIKSAHSFGCAHMGSMCIHVFIEVSDRSIYVCTVFLKKIRLGLVRLFQEQRRIGLE